MGAGIPTAKRREIIRGFWLLALGRYRHHLDKSPYRDMWRCLELRI